MICAGGSSKGGQGVEPGGLGSEKDIRVSGGNDLAGRDVPEIVFSRKGRTLSSI